MQNTNLTNMTINPDDLDLCESVVNKGKSNLRIPSRHYISNGRADGAILTGLRIDGALFVVEFNDGEPSLLPVTGRIVNLTVGGRLTTREVGAFLDAEHGRKVAIGTRGVWIVNTRRRTEAGFPTFTPC
jgi:hypothetical protein